MSAFWTIWIIALTLGNIAFALWLLSATSRRRSGDSAAGPETTGHTWDGDLAEYNNPLPRWWLGMFYLSIAFALGYLVIYPGLGAFGGTQHWTAAGQWRAEVADQEQRTAPIYARYAAMEPAALQADAEAMHTARNLFVANCAQCHGADGHGARGFPNLSARNWQWGREPATVIETITDGRQAQMPAWKGVLSEQELGAVVTYVAALSHGGSDAAGPGQAVFATYCAACHGADAHGTEALGAPNLADENWLYGGSEATIRETVSAGRNGQMPAHGARLSPVQVKLLAAYVLGLSGAAGEAAR